MDRLLTLHHEKEPDTSNTSNTHKMEAPFEKMAAPRKKMAAPRKKMAAPRKKMAPLNFTIVPPFI